MRRIVLRGLAGAGVVLALVVAAVVVALLTVDVGSLVRLAQSRVKAATGRDLVVAGPVALDVSLTPSIVLNDVAFGNAAWGGPKDMVTAKRVAAKVALLPLVTRRQVHVLELALGDPVIALETDRQGRGNWELGADGAGTGAPARGGAAAAAFAVERLIVERGALSYRNGADGTTTRAVVERLTLRMGAGEAPIEMDLRGSVGDVPLALTGRLGSVDALRGARWPFPVSVRGEVAGKPAAFAAHVTAGDDALAFDDLDVAFGAFKATGRLARAVRANRAAYTFRLKTPALSVADLPLPAGARPSAAGATGVSGSRFVFPDTPVPLDALRALDAEGELAIGALRAAERVELANLDLRLALRRGRLDVAKFTADALGGSVAGSVVLDASRASSPTFALRAESGNLDLGRILAAVGTPREVRGGRTTLAVDVTARGASPRAWAASASGTVTAVVGPTTLVNTRLDLDKVLDKLAQAVNPFRAADPSTELACAVLRIPLSDGIARIDRSIAAETNKVSVSASGTLDFRSETLDLALRPRVRQGIPVDIPRIAELVRFQGPFTQPRMSIDAMASAAAVAKLGAAIGTGGLAALGSSLLGRGAAAEDVCDVALGRKPAAAPPAGAPAATPADPGAALADDLGKAVGRLFRR